jgi:hypothetical protein
MQALQGRHREESAEICGIAVHLLPRPFRALLCLRDIPGVPLRSTLGCSVAPFQGFNPLPPLGRFPDTTRSAGGVFIDKIIYSGGKL